MATNPKVIEFVSSAQVVPPVESISQLRLALVLSLRSRVRQVQAELEKQETELRTMIEAGVTIEAGEHTVTLQTNTRRNVAWKSITMRLAKRLGLDPDAYCSNVLVHTKPTKSVSLEIN